MNTNKIAENNKILEIKFGSHLYGTNSENSDIDLSGIFLPTKEMIFGFQKIEEVDLSIKDKNKNGKNTKDAIDRKLYEFRRFIKLALDNNPNIIEHLFVDKKNIVFINEFGQELLNQKHLFPHKESVKKFKGYAFSQKHKMVIKTNNYHQLVNTRDYFLEYKNKKELLIELKDKKLPFLKFSDNFCTVGDLNLQKNIFVKKALNIIEERLSKVGNRKELFTKYGYDTKFASHLIRLLLESKELLTNCEIKFPLSYKNVILDIKNGKWKIKDILDYSEELDKEIDNLILKSELPDKPRTKEVEEFMIDLLYEILYSLSILK